ncbi:thiol reductant ABC exporter subunit CydD [Aureimonas populi]|uniref:Thiol reductant ABC exporter subunit CydD n=1 Tax=Aureimonas populi TaxID=1701758 RepID=A0ABW5CQL5_9HYPH|nr:thiol reductant ABC exporter subunit CydD [Aureimonas populi]
MAKTHEATGDGRADMRWLGALRRHGGAPLALALLLPFLAGALLVPQAWLVADILHEAIEEGAPRAALLPAIGLVATIFLARAALGALAERAGVSAAERIKAVLRGALFSRTLAERNARLGRRSSGARSSVIVDQVEALDGFFARFLPATIQAAVLPLAFAAVLFPVDWVVALLFLCTAPLIPVFMALAGWGAEAATKAQAAAFTRLSGRFADRLRGLLTLKLLGREAHETNEARAAGEELRLRTMRVLRIAFLSSAVLEFFAALGVAGVALYVGLTYLGMIDLRGSVLTLQMGLFCLLMAPEVYQPLRTLAAHYHDRAAAKAAVEEIALQFEGLPEVRAEAPPLPASAPALPAGPARVRIEGFCVTTPDGARPVLSGVDLDIAPGERIAILGPSGIGKSTFLEALAGLRAHGGTIRIDGVPLGETPEPALRRRVAFLGQRPRIFCATLAANIRLGRAGASGAELRHAAELAGVLPFARTLEEGFDTLVGEAGLGLSGGEAHRLALARIFLRDPGLVLLDEPTAHLDAETEALVLDGLERFCAGRTLVLVTHSAAVAARMDRVFRVAGGTLIEAAHKRRRVDDLALEGAA